MDLKLFEGMKKGKSGLDSCGPFFFFQGTELNNRFVSAY